jgi:dimethylamine monooxygenase subunit A
MKKADDGEGGVTMPAAFDMPPLMPQIRQARYLPFGDGQPYQMRMGLQPLPSEQWIEIDGAFAAQLSAKRALLEMCHDEVFQALPDAQFASDETLRLLLQHLREHHSDRFEFDGALVRNRTTGERWDIGRSPLHPLDQAGRLVQEDFCILQPDGEHYRLTAGAVCFPSNWRLADKIGQRLADVHGPVPGYADKLEKPVDRFFNNLSADALVWRANWAIHDNPALFRRSHDPTPTTVTSNNAGEALWFRVERQTLRRLPESGAVLFTIRTHLTQLRQAICDSKSARDLAAVIRSMPDAVLGYRSMNGFQPALLDWLDQIAR